MFNLESLIPKSKNFLQPCILWFLSGFPTGQPLTHTLPKSSETWAIPIVSLWFVLPWGYWKWTGEIAMVSTNACQERMIRKRETGDHFLSVSKSERNECSQLDRQECFSIRNLSNTDTSAREIKNKGASTLRRLKSSYRCRSHARSTVTWLMHVKVYQLVLPWLIVVGLLTRQSRNNDIINVDKYEMWSGLLTLVNGGRSGHCNWMDAFTSSIIEADNESEINGTRHSTFDHLTQTEISQYQYTGYRPNQLTSQTNRGYRDLRVRV